MLLYGRGYFVKIKIIYRKFILWLFILQRLFRKKVKNLRHLNYSKIFSLSGPKKALLRLGKPRQQTIKALPLKKKASDLRFMNLKRLTTNIQNTQVLPKKNVRSILSYAEKVSLAWLPSTITAREGYHLNIIERSGQKFNKFIIEKNKKIFRKLFLLQIVILTTLIIFVIIGATHFWKRKSFSGLNHNTTEQQLLISSQKFLQRADKAPAVFGDVTSQNNIWYVAKSSIIDHDVTSYSNIPGIPWIFDLSYFFYSDNKFASPIIQQIYLMHVWIKATPLFSGNKFTPAINIYKNWTTDYHYYVIQNFKGVFYKTTNRFKFYHGGYKWNAYWKPKVRYNLLDYYYLDYYIDWRLSGEYFDIHSFTIKPTNIFLSAPLIRSTNFDYKNLHYPFKNVNGNNLIIGAFKGPEEVPISSYKLKYSVLYRDFALMPTFGPANHDLPKIKPRTPVSNWTKTIKLTNRGKLAPGWGDNTLKSYSWSIDSNQMFADVFKPETYHLIQQIKIWNNLTINTCFQDHFDLNLDHKLYTSSMPNRLVKSMPIFQQLLDWQFVGASDSSAIAVYWLKYINTY